MLVIGTAILTVLIGVAVGILSAMFGIGGGVVMVPIIRIIFERAAVVSSATSLFAIVPTSIMGIIARKNDKSINYRVGLTLGIAGSITAPLGATMATRLPGEIAMVITACLIIYTAYKQFKKAAAMKAVELGEKPAASAKPKRKPLEGKAALACGCAIGGLAGIASGFLGIGGGFIIVPLMVAYLGLDMKQATGTSLVAIGILAIPGVISHALYGNIDYLLGLLFILGSIPGAKIGAVFVQRFSNRRLTFLFGIVLVMAGVLLAVRELV